jgi:uncharacterized protein
MITIDQRITEYIQNNKVFTLATSGENVPWCALCYYAYDKENNLLIFKSDIESRHIRELFSQPRVAGTIYKPATTPAKITGLQFTAEVIQADKILMQNLKSIYLKRFPLAAVIEAQLFVLQPDYCKMTDNRLGFGKKIIWQKEAERSEAYEVL